LKKLRPLSAEPAAPRRFVQDRSATGRARTRFFQHKEKYPNDRATGYREGDLRGAVSVKIALPARADK
jgi:hypothetical protein